MGQMISAWPPPDRNRYGWKCLCVYLELVIPSSLHSVCYERVPWYPTVLTFILSALWHGVYPGYYFTFLTGVPVTLAARAVSFFGVYALFFKQSDTCMFVVIF